MPPVWARQSPTAADAGAVCVTYHPAPPMPPKITRAAIQPPILRLRGRGGGPSGSGSAGGCSGRGGRGARGSRGAAGAAACGGAARGATERRDGVRPGAAGRARPAGAGGCRGAGRDAAAGRPAGAAGGSAAARRAVRWAGGAGGAARAWPAAGWARADAGGAAGLLRCGLAAGRAAGPGRDCGRAGRLSAAGTRALGGLTLPGHGRAAGARRLRGACGNGAGGHRRWVRRRRRGTGRAQEGTGGSRAEGRAGGLVHLSLPWWCVRTRRRMHPKGDTRDHHDGADPVCVG